MGSPLVFVPVFGKLDLTRRALRALDAHTPNDVAFLVVDDVHEDLTPAEHELALARLRELTRGGTTVVTGSLDPALASRADVVLALGPDGRPVAVGPRGAESDDSLAVGTPRPSGSVPTARPEADHALV